MNRSQSICISGGSFMAFVRCTRLMAIAVDIAVHYPSGFAPTFKHLFAVFVQPSSSSAIHGFTCWVLVLFTEWFSLNLQESFNSTSIPYWHHRKHPGIDHSTGKQWSFKPLGIYLSFLRSMNFIGTPLLPPSFIVSANGAFSKDFHMENFYWEMFLWRTFSSAFIECLSFSHCQLL